MAVIRDGKLVDSTWQFGNLNDPLPNGPLIVPFARWQTERAKILGETRPYIGVSLNSEESIEELSTDLAHLQAVALDFPVFKDGRHYTTARLLRERYRFQGDIIATGDVLIDQLYFMQRVGFNVMVLRDDQDAATALSVLARRPATYQAAADEKQPFYRRRNTVLS
ncbi:MAG: DUF934 domain-containing protein [Pseudomonadota bacterium]|nr:DUF934 domain-containing protein [Pseudomonadota bacterium]